MAQQQMAQPVPKPMTHPPPPARQQVVSLPPGWATHYHSNGRPYYYNKTLNKSTWDKPSGSTEEDMRSIENQQLGRPNSGDEFDDFNHDVLLPRNI